MTRLQLLSERDTKTHEEKQQEVAFELHEELGQDLTTLMLRLEMVESQRGREDFKEQIQNARAITALILERVRNLALNLRPPLLDDFGLYKALRTYCTEQAKTAGWMMHFDVPESEARPHRDVEIACFRLVQEALTNVARHASATEVWVELRRSEDEFRLNVRDNGTGFDAAARRQHVGYENLGLIGMEERVRQVGGRLEIESSPGGGTEVRAIFPLCSSFPDELCRPVESPRCAECHVTRAGGAAGSSPGLGLKT